LTKNNTEVSLKAFRTGTCTCYSLPHKLVQDLSSEVSST